MTTTAARVTHDAARRGAGRRRPDPVRRSMVGAAVLILTTVAVVPLGVTALVVAASSPASATSCILPPLATPLSIAEGTEDLGYRADERTAFRDEYVGAVMGTVRALRSPGDVGPVDVVVDVTASLGRDVGTEVVITQDDLGQMMGHQLTVGEHYFIPYTVRDGVLHAFVCDPMSPMAADEAPAVVTAALAGAWPGEARMATPSPAPTSAPTAEVAGVIGEHGWPFADELLTAAMVVGPLAAGATLWALVRRRRRTEVETPPARD